jgi:hypothetical protein
MIRVKIGAMLLGGALMVAGGEAFAGNPAAARAYEDGVAAADRGDHAAAAKDFARADELSPNPVALGAALDAAVAADDGVLAMELVQRAEDRAVEGAAAASAEAAKSKFRGRVGRIRIACVDCEAKVDGVEAPVNRARWIEVGTHTVTFWKDGAEVDRRSVKVEGDKTAKVSPHDPSAGAPEAEEAASGTAAAAAPAAAQTAVSSKLSPAWFWTAAGITGAMAIGTIASGVDTVQQHSDFLLHPTDEGARAGQAADSRTQILLGTTAAFAVGTAALGVFGIDWSSGKPAAPAVMGIVAPVPGGFTATVGGRF